MSRISTCAFWAAACVSLTADIARAQVSPDHALYQMPAYRPDTVRIQRVNDLIGGENSGDSLRWDLELPRLKCHVGEVLWGKLTLKNRAKSTDFVLSPPYNGEFVSTLSLWVSTPQSCLGERLNWSDPTEVYLANKGPFDAYLQYRGFATTIVAQSSLVYWIPINVSQPTIGSATVPGGHGRCAWFPGAGMNRPGKYRFYLKYVNQDGLSRRRGAWSPPEGLPFRVEDAGTDPIVLGPFEVEILPLTHYRRGPAFENAQSLEEMIEGWSKVHSGSCKVTNSLHVDLWRLPGILRRLDRTDLSVRWPMEHLLMTQESLNHEITGELQDEPAFDLRELGGEWSHCARQPDPVPQNAWVERNERNWAAMLQAVKDDDPLGPFVRLSYCQYLYARERHEEAIQLARLLKNPDAEVFLDDVERACAKAAPAIKSR